MSVQINFRAAPNGSKWATLKNGEFAILEGSAEVPIPNGLYRIFRSTPPEGETVITIVPLFDGNFDDGLFPLFIDPAIGYPVLKHRVSKIGIDAEVIQ